MKLSAAFLIVITAVTTAENSESFVNSGQSNIGHMDSGGKNSGHMSVGQRNSMRSGVFSPSIHTHRLGSNTHHNSGGIQTYSSGGIKSHSAGGLSRGRSAGSLSNKMGSHYPAPSRGMGSYDAHIVGRNPQRYGYSLSSGYIGGIPVPRATSAGHQRSGLHVKTDEHLGGILSPRTFSKKHKKGISSKKAIPIKKGISSKKAIPIKKGISSKKAIPIKKGISSKKAIPIKKGISSKKTIPIKKGISSKKGIPIKKAISGIEAISGGHMGGISGNRANSGGHMGGPSSGVLRRNRIHDGHRVGQSSPHDGGSMYSRNIGEIYRGHQSSGTHKNSARHIGGISGERSILNGHVGGIYGEHMRDTFGERPFSERHNGEISFPSEYMEGYP